MSREQFVATVTFDYIQEDMEDRIVNRVSEMFFKQLESRLQKLVDGKLNKLIDEKLKEFSEQQLMNKFQVSNEWGESTGKSKTFKEVVMERLENHLQQKVDSSGNDTNRYDDKERRIEYIMRKATKSVFDEAFGTKLTEIITEIKAKVTDQVTANIKEAVIKNLKL